MTDLRFGVLGPLEVWRDGRRLTVPGGRRRGVLAALLVHAPKSVPVDALVEAAWAGEFPVDPRAALHTVVSRLRGLLGERAVLIGPAGYQLDVPADALDAHRFERLFSAAAGARPERAGRLLDEALDLWRGKAYAEFADRDFVALEARRLELLRIDALEERAQVALESGDPEQAVRRLERLLAEEPFREHAVELLMTALERTGRTRQALARYREHRRLMVEELGLEPAPALQRLEARILGRGGPGRAGPVSAPSWLDTSTAFVGRRTDLAALVRAVAGNRVVTVTGTGGVGKSRLVAEALPALADRIRLPITVVELAPVGSGGVAVAIAQALGLGPGDATRALLLDHLRATGALLVLDNCEHVRGEVAAIVDLLVHRCPAVRLVLTSRRRLDLTSERVLPLAPLPLPAADGDQDQASPAASVRLLAERVCRVRPEFAVTPGNLPAVVDICRRLDGLPLALELAASRIAVLGVGQVRDRLEHDPGVLDEAAGGSRSIRALVDWSGRLLTADQRELFAALSVFPGEFDRAAAEGLARRLRPPHAGSEVSGSLAELSESSLLSTRHGPGGARYRMLTVVRAQAERMLADAGRTDGARMAHAMWVAELTEQAAQDYTGPGCADALRRLGRSRRDIELALAWTLASGELDLAATVAAAVERCPHWIPPRELQERVIEVGERCLRHGGPGATRGVSAAAVALAVRGDLVRGLELARTALRSASTTAERYLGHLAEGVAAMYSGDSDRSAGSWKALTDLPDLPLALRSEAHSSLALLARYAGDIELAREQSMLAVLLSETSGAASAHAFALYAAGEAAVGEPDRGIGQLTEAAEEAELIGSPEVSMLARVALFAALVRTGRHEEAARVAVPLLRDIRRAGAWPQLWTTVRILAELQAEAGRVHEATLLLAAADAQPAAPPVSGDDVPRYAALHNSLRARLGDHIFARIQAVAGVVSREQVADRASALVARRKSEAVPP